MLLKKSLTSSVSSDRTKIVTPDGLLNCVCPGLVIAKEMEQLVDCESVDEVVTVIVFEGFDSAAVNVSDVGLKLISLAQLLEEGVSSKVL